MATRIIHITTGLLFWPSYATALFIAADWLRYGGL